MRKLRLQIAISNLILVLLHPIFGNPAFSDQVYKWVDKQGNTHYGDSPLNTRKADALNLNITPPLITESEREMQLKSEQYYESQRLERQEQIEAAHKRKLQQQEIRKAVRDELQRQKFAPPNIKIHESVDIINPDDLNVSRDEKCRIYRELVRRLSKPVSRRDYLRSEMNVRQYNLGLNKRLMRHFC